MDNKTPNAISRSLPALLLALVLVGCGGDSDPTRPPAGSTVSFRPSSLNLILTVGDETDLWVGVVGTDSYTVAWRYGLLTADTDTFRLVADRVGVDTVRATVVTADREQSRDWHVEVLPDLSKLPREVSGLTLAHGPDPAEVVVSWSRSSQTAHPLESYEVAVSYDGPVNNGNWDTAVIVADTPHAGQPLRPRLVISSTTHGLVPGQRAWFAVRALDDAGQASLVKESFPWDVTYPWRLDVHVQDDQGLPLESVILIYGPDDKRAATDGGGNCNLGPFRNIDVILVATRAGVDFYNYTAAAQGVDDGPLLLTLVERYELDLVDCGVATPATEFMAYLQHMTKTDTQFPHRPNQELYRWRRYPVQVYFAEWDTLDVQLGDSLRSAMEIWNGQLGFDIMTETLDEVSADVRCSLVATEVALHEFGHVLGLYDHFCLSGKGNLMDNGGAFGSLEFGPENAIKAAELRAVRTIYNLPQGVDMAGYERD